MRFTIFLVLCSQAFAGYGAKASVSFNAASGTSTDTNITLYFSGSDNNLRTVANGGLIQNTVSHGGITVPADFVITNDSTCATVTGSYTWGFKTYSATSGTLVGRILVPSLTTATAVVPTVCIGNAAVNTYQGGAVGAEFDTNVKGAWDFPNGTTLSAVDSSSSANNGTLTNTPTASAGHVGGGAATFAAASSQFDAIAGNPAALQITGSMTWEGWFNSATLPASMTGQVLVGKDDAVGTRGPFMYVYNNSTNTELYADVFVTSAPAMDNIFNDSTSLSASTWYYAALVFDQTNKDALIYLNGALSVGGGVSFGGVETQNNPTANMNIGARVSGAGNTNYLNGQMEDVRISSSARSADWLLTTYNNQNSPPLIGAFTSLKTSGQFPRIN